MSHNPDAIVGENGEGLGESPEKEAVLVMFLPPVPHRELQFNKAAVRERPSCNDQVVGTR